MTIGALKSSRRGEKRTASSTARLNSEDTLTTDVAALPSLPLGSAGEKLERDDPLATGLPGSGYFRV